MASLTHQSETSLSEVKVSTLNAGNGASLNLWQERIRVKVERMYKMLIKTQTLLDNLLETDITCTKL